MSAPADPAAPTRSPGSAPTLRTALRERPKVGEHKSGDRAIIVTRARGQTLLAVVDALGHGEIAHEIAHRAAAALEPLEAPSVEKAIEAVHVVLRGTRGAGALVCTFHEHHVRAGGVGNVELRTDGMPLSVALTPGILGVHRGPVQVFEAVARAGARLALFSDGVAPRLDLRDVRSLGLDDAAEELFRRHAHTFDDATLLLVEV